MMSSGCAGCTLHTCTVTHTHSRTHILFASFVRIIQSIFREYLLVLWAVVVRSGSWATQHWHISREWRHGAFFTSFSLPLSPSHTFSLDFIANVVVVVFVIVKHLGLIVFSPFFIHCLPFIVQCSYICFFRTSLCDPLYVPCVAWMSLCICVPRSYMVHVPHVINTLRFKN